MHGVLNAILAILLLGLLFVLVVGLLEPVIRSTYLLSR